MGNWIESLKAQWSCWDQDEKIIVILSLFALAVLGVSLLNAAVGEFYGGYVSEGIVYDTSCSSALFSGCDVGLLDLTGSSNSVGYLGEPIIPEGVRIGRYCRITKQGLGLKSSECSDYVPSAYASRIYANASISS